MSLQEPTIEDSSGEPLDFNLSWSVRVGKADKTDLTPFGKDEHYWTLTISWTYPEGAKAPYTLDPTMSFDGSTFTIEDAQWEVKTYQQLWTLSYGTNNRYSGGFMTGTTDGILHVLNL